MSPVPVRHAGVADVDLDGDALLFDGEMLHRLTGTGAAVWRHIDGVRTVSDIVTLLAAEYAAEEQVVAADVQQLCDQLEQQGVIVLAEPAAGGHFVRPAHVGWVRDGDHVLVGDLRSGTRHALTPTGAQVWELACDRLSSAEVVAVLQAEHPDADAADVTGLLDHLCDAGLLQRREPR